MSNRKYTHDLENIITHGHETLDSKETVEVNLKDLMYIYGTLQEYVRFFHQPDHYESLGDVQEFLGSVNDNAGYKILSTSLYQKMQNVFPSHIKEKINNNVFESNEIPFYYEDKK